MNHNIDATASQFMLTIASAEKKNYVKRHYLAEKSYQVVRRNFMIFGHIKFWLTGFWKTDTVIIIIILYQK